MVLQLSITNALGRTSGGALRLEAGDRVADTASMTAFFAASAGAPDAVRGAIIQFDAIPSEGTRDALAALGVRLGSYIPDQAFVAAIPATVSRSALEALGVRWVGTMRPDEKIPAALREAGQTPDWCRDQAGVARFTVRFFPHVDLTDAAQWLAAEYGATTLGQAPITHAIAVGLPAENWSDLAADERVLWVEPFWPRVEHNNSNRANVRADTAQAAPYSLTGDGVMVGQWDGGRADPSHADFGGRVISGDASSLANHATHVAGTVLGSGTSSGGTYKGMAPGASLLTQLWWNDAAELENEFQSAIDDAGMDISQNSWGVGYSPVTVNNCNAFLGNYFLECGTLDDLIRGSLGKPVTVSWSAGNERGTSSDYCGSVGFTWGTVTPYGTAKNVITVGAINSNNSTMTSFSSWGPTDDGRLKPELVAPGCQTNSDYGVTSTKVTSGYTVMCGTSMAAPTVTGCAALWLERYKDHHGSAPLASTVKAAFVESAYDLGDTGPEYDYGYGRVNVTAAVDLLDAGTILEDEVQNGGTVSWTFPVDGSLGQVSFTLAWDDPGAAENASVTLINDLDICLIPPSGSPVRYPWVLDPSSPSSAPTTGVDDVNNLEQVRLTGTLETGTWLVEVTGTSVPEGPQAFSLAYSAGITLTSTSVPYAVWITAAADTGAPAGSVPVRFTLDNAGQQNDTYDVILTSARGWTIAPNPVAVALAGGDDSLLTFTLTVPPEAEWGGADSVVAVAVSQGSGTVSDRDTIAVTVLSGCAVAVTTDADTVGVPGKRIEIPFLLTNSGIAADSFAWSVSDNAAWPVDPAAGTLYLPVSGDTALIVAVTIPPTAEAWELDRVIMTAVSLGDAQADDADTAKVLVILVPPPTVLVEPIAGTYTSDFSPALRWTRSFCIIPPEEYGSLLHVVEISPDPTFVVDVQRSAPQADTVFVPDSLVDGAHYWRAAAFNLYGDSGGFSAASYLVVDTRAPDAPTLISPSDGTVDADSTPVCTWNSVPLTKSGQATTMMYLWEAATDSAFTTGYDSIWTTETSYQVPGEAAFPTCSTTIHWRVTARDPAGNLSSPSAVAHYGLYRPGDVKFDCLFDVRDVVVLIDVVFRGESAPTPEGRAETNCTPPINIQDVVRLIDHVFRGDPPPCSPS